MKKHLAKITSVLVAALLTLSACSAGGGSSSGSSSGSGSGSSGASSDSAKTQNITYVNMSYGDKTGDLPAIQAKLNEITKADINVTVTIKEIEFSNYTQQISTMLASNESVDLISVWNNLTNLVNQHQIVPLNTLLDSNGKDIESSLGKLLDGTKVKGSIYAIPFNSSKLYVTNAIFNKNLLDKYHLDPDSIKSYKDLANLFAVIKKNEPNVTPFNFTSYTWPSYAIMGSIDNYDALGDGIGVLTQNKDLNVVDLYETPQYKDLVTTMHDWYQKGYFDKDAATSSDMGFTQYQQQKLFCLVNVDTLTQFDKSYQNIGYNSMGFPSVCKALNIPVISNSSGFYCNAVPSTSKHPDAAIKWLNYLYSNKDAANLLYYGIEGTDYVKNADGTVSNTPSNSAANAKWSTDLIWSFGNQSLMYATKGLPVDFNSKKAALNANAAYSVAFGFNFDASSVKNEFTAVNNVISQYRRPLECGSVDPATALPEFISKLKTAGIDKIIAAKQAQLTDWAKNKG